jgi:ATP-dependent helicase/nuclease subunit A
MLKIYKASAGSGKTHNLTHTYIDMLLEHGDEDAFRHILAVTFTNKATDEMKQRILDELYRVSVDFSDSRKAEEARRVLIEMLNDYNSFNICTIDRFFQKILRSFAKEVGQFASYNVELDQESVLSEAIDMLMESLEKSDKSELLSWLIKLSVNAIESGKSWNPLPSLKTLGRELFSEDYIVRSRKLESQWNDRGSIDVFRGEMEKIYVDFKQKSISLGARGNSLFVRFGLDPSDFIGGSRSALHIFLKWKNGEIKVPTDSFVQIAEGPVDGYCSKNADFNIRQRVESAYSEGLGELMTEAVNLYGDEYEKYISSKVILDNLFTVGLLNDIESFIAEYCKRKNIVILSRTSDFLNKIIDQNDTPFIYEKTGSWIDHYMLDEFQDTSLMQWDNFLPLIKDSLAANKNNLIVGDVKQSIYRWRNSDWNLLNSEIYREFSESSYKKEYLNDNWRSLKNIIDFNNDFFIRGAEVLQNVYNDQTDTHSSFIKDIYSSEEVIQNIPSKRDNLTSEGHLKLSFVSRDENEEGWKKCVLDRLPTLVATLVSHGYSMNDVAFLVRTNADGAMLAEFLIDQGYKVVSEDSLLISSSCAVNKIITALKYSSNNDDSVSKFLFKNGIIETNEKSLYNLCEEIIHSLSDSERGEGIFIQAFMDCVVNFISINGSDITGFVKWWDDVGRKRSISAPDGKDALRIMTVHKSKGLGIKVVIIPFMADAFYRESGDILWCTPEQAPFDMMKLIPVKSSSDLKNSIFANEYLKEKLYSYVDCINLAYVAFTRAKEELIIFSPMPKIKKDGSFNVSTIADALYFCYNKELNGDNEYELGSWVSGAKEKKGDLSFTPSLEEDGGVFISIPIGKRLKLSYSGEDFFSEENIRNKGVVMHDILSSISLESDLGGVIKNAVSDGIILSFEEEQLSELLLLKLKSVRDRHWFDGTYVHHNESTIIDSDGDMYRPDRVMIKGDSAVIVDYKFGVIRSNKYIRQVENYKSLMSRMGFGDVTGYIWYLEDNNILEI